MVLLNQSMGFGKNSWGRLPVSAYGHEGILRCIISEKIEYFSRRSSYNNSVLYECQNG